MSAGRWCRGEGPNLEGPMYHQVDSAALLTGMFESGLLGMLECAVKPFYTCWSIPVLRVNARLELTQQSPCSISEMSICGLELCILYFGQSKLCTYLLVSVARPSYIV